MAHPIPSVPPAAVPDGVAARVAGFVEATLGRGIEWIAALIIAVEIVLLLAGVIARYFLHTPIIWVDEVASILFLSVSYTHLTLPTKRIV